MYHPVTERLHKIKKIIFFIYFPLKNTFTYLAVPGLNCNGKPLIVAW